MAKSILHRHQVRQRHPFDNTFGRTYEVLSLRKKYTEIGRVSLFDRAGSYFNGIDFSVDLKPNPGGIDAIERLLVSSDQLNRCAALRYAGSE
jgi:hypothetical protein